LLLVFLLLPLLFQFQAKKMKINDQANSETGHPVYQDASKADMNRSSHWQEHAFGSGLVLPDWPRFSPREQA
jgi:hypothetical protein